MNEFAHYLEAKRTVDDRAIDRRVLETLRRRLENIEGPAIADIGAGVGTGIERLVDWGVVAEPIYTAIEPDRELLADARSRLEARLHGEFIASTLTDFAAKDDNHARYDLVIAHAFLDIVELAPALKNLVSLARPGGFLYFPITFDGETIFEPAREDDAAILSRYHASMGAIGDSKTGRKLVHALQEHPVDVVEMASSDWIVFPTAGSYPSDEAFFLKFVVGMVERTLGERAKRWAAARREQIDDGQLLYIAHQIDCLARKR